jgi:hypothetical protein
VVRRRLALLLGVLSVPLSAPGGAAFAQSLPHAAHAGATPQGSAGLPPRHVEHSESVAPVRLLVLEAVPEFAARVSGQVSDLGLALAVEAASPVATHAEVEALVAGRAAGQDADVVAWLGELPGEGPAAARGMTVYVWIVGHERLHARRVGPRALGASSADDRSTTLEAAALVVRGAVRAVSFERESRRHATAPPEALTAVLSPALLSPVVPPPPVSPAPLPGAAPEADRGAGDSDEREPHAVRWSPHAGVDWSHAGLNPNGFWSANAGLALHWGSLSGGMRAGWSFVEPVAYRGVAFELERRELVAELGWAVLQRPGFVLRPQVGAGAAWLTRTTRGLAGSGDPEPPSTSVSALVSGELVAEYRLAGPLTLGLHGGLRWFAHTTRYVVDAPIGDVALAAGWRVQPNAGIALGALF